MARGTTDVSLAQRREKVDGNWNRASRPPRKRPRPRPTKKQREAATDSIVVDLAEWLTGRRTVMSQIEAIATKIGEDVVRELDRSWDESHRAARRKMLAESHFWCDILAGLAKTLNDVQEEITKAFDQIPDLVVSAIDPHSAIGRATVKLAVDETWDQIKELDFIKAGLAAFDFSESVRAIRMLAIMICFAPEHHEAVVKYCVNPLFGECVSNMTKQRLKAALPEEWLE
jgi:hypothetical protein